MPQGPVGPGTMLPPHPPGSALTSNGPGRTLQNRASGGREGVRQELPAVASRGAWVRMG